MSNLDADTFRALVLDHERHRAMVRKAYAEKPAAPDSLPGGAPCRTADGRPPASRADYIAAAMQAFEEPLSKIADSAERERRRAELETHVTGWFDSLALDAIAVADALSTFQMASKIADAEAARRFDAKYAKALMYFGLRLTDSRHRFTDKPDELFGRFGW